LSLNANGAAACDPSLIDGLEHDVNPRYCAMHA
jgi:hypothetical protein